ncbi:MAG: type II toxin-antitoxin system HicA family toxin [Acidimicrobiales bacterium]
MIDTTPSYLRRLDEGPGRDPNVGTGQVAQRGSHRQFRHPVRQGRVTVAGRPGQEMAPGTLGSILRQAGLSREDR